MSRIRTIASPARASRRRRRVVTCIAPLATIAVAFAVVLPTTVSDAAQAPVGLGTATSFAVLAGSGITNTGATTLSGDRGTFPTTTESGTGTITQASGVDNAGNAVTQGAKDDLVTGYNTAAGAPSTSVPVELGAGKTFLPGVYNAGTLGITGTMTLNTLGDPNAVFIFKAASTLTTAANSNVVVIGSTTACNVFWQIGSSATLGVGSHLVGSVLAFTSITATTGATIQGRLLARNGAVTLDNNTITRPVCAAAATTTTTTAGGGGTTATTTPAGGGGTTTTRPGTPAAGPGTTAPGTPAAPGTPGSPATPLSPGTPGAPGSPPLPETL